MRSFLKLAAATAAGAIVVVFSAFWLDATVRAAVDPGQLVRPAEPVSSIFRCPTLGLVRAVLARKYRALGVPAGFVVAALPDGGKVLMVFAGGAGPVEMREFRRGCLVG